MGYNIEILNLLENKRIVIYGAGLIAMQFYDALKKYGLENNIDCFVVSRKNDGIDKIKGIPLKSIYEFENREDKIVCLAVHEMTKSDIEEIFEREKISNYVWIVPYLFRLILDYPIATGVYVPTNEIIRYARDYRIAIRYLAIENYFGKNDQGFAIYEKSMRLYCKKETAKKRMQFFLETIQNWDENGYQSSHNIVIDKSGNLLDGAHRIALAKYFHIESVSCDVYHSRNNRHSWVENKTLMKKDTLLKANFTSDELTLIEDADKKVRGVNNEGTE